MGISLVDSIGGNSGHVLQGSAAIHENPALVCSNARLGVFHDPAVRQVRSKGFLLVAVCNQKDVALVCLSNVSRRAAEVGEYLRNTD